MKKRLEAYCGCTLTLTSRIASTKSRGAGFSLLSFFLMSIGKGTATFSSSETLKTLLLIRPSASILLLSLSISSLLSNLCSLFASSPSAEILSAGSGATREGYETGDMFGTSLTYRMSSRVHNDGVSCCCGLRGCWRGGNGGGGDGVGDWGVGWSGVEGSLGFTV